MKPEPTHEKGPWLGPEASLLVDGSTYIWTFVPDKRPYKWTFS